VQNWNLSVREEHKLKVFENRALKNKFGPRGRKQQETGENYIIRSCEICIFHQL
jgi:hypothetical protein